MTRIVIDLSPYYAADLVAHLREDDVDGWRYVADTIEAQLPKPKPAEPTGLGAVVQDDAGEAWIRVSLGDCSDSGHDPTSCWVRNGDVYADTWCRYADLDVVRVLSEGVTA